MSESERRRKYRYDRVLIETARVLPSMLADAVVFLSGAQLEMLRNVTQYLRRLETYVTEYNPGYYLAPIAEDYDDILAIVADLEEVLMGNPNTLWGYNDSYADVRTIAETDPGVETLTGSVVPAGEAWRVTGASVFAASSTCTDVRILAYVDGVHIMVANQRPPTNGHWHPFQCDVILSAGDYFYVSFYGLTQDDTIVGHFWGYKMVVPE